MSIVINLVCGQIVRGQLVELEMICMKNATFILELKALIVNNNELSSMDGLRNLKDLNTLGKDSMDIIDWIEVYVLELI